MSLKNKFKIEADNLNVKAKEIASHLNSSFTATSLSELLESEDKIYYASVINRFIESILPLSNSLNDIFNGIDKEKLNVKVVSSITEIQDSLNSCISKSSELITQSKELQEQITNLERENSVLLGNENAVKKLSSNKTQLLKRISELKSLEKIVKENGLEDIEAEITELSKKYKTEENRFNILIGKRDKLFKEQKEREEALQKVIHQTALIGNTKDIFDDFKTKCEEHNIKMLELQTNKTENLLINLNFLSETSKGLINSSMNDKLVNAEVLIKEVESLLKEKIE